MVERSPNFPSMSLGEAIDAVRLVYQREGRTKMPRLSAVRPLGYTSINGRSLSVLGALRAYDLLEGRGDDVKISDDAITILNAPQGSDERRDALVRAFEAPASFALLRSKGDASPDTLRWHLIKANFRDDAADKLLKVYLASRELVNATVGAYGAGTASPQESSEQSKARPQLGDLVRWESAGMLQFDGRPVKGFSDDGEWAFVEGSQTGILISELEVVERAPPPLAPHAYIGAPSVAPNWRSGGNAEPDFVVKLGGGRVAFIEIKGGEAEPRHLAKLARFIKLQESLLRDDEGEDEDENSPITGLNENFPGIDQR